MDLPPDKMRILRSYDLNKKWELVCDQVSQCILLFYLIIVFCLFLTLILRFFIIKRF